LAPHSERNPFVTLRKITEVRSARSLLDVAAGQEHQQLVARHYGNGGAQVAALDIGRLEVQQAI
jgi:hypothetical protein